MHHIPLYKCWNWGSNRLTAKLSVGPGFILSFTAYDLDTGAWVPPAWWKHIQVKRQLQWCDGNLDCMVCILSPGPRPCSCIPLGSPSQCLSMLTLPLPLPIPKSFLEPTAERKTIFPKSYRQRRSLQRHGPKAGWEGGRKGSNWSLRHFGSSPFFLLFSLVAFKFHSLFQRDLGIGLKFQ